jgi:hypothetical protein
MDILINSQLSPAPAQPSLLDLNDYCLLEIFGYLKLDDLIITSTVCTRFEYITERLYPRRLKLWKDISSNVNTNRFVLSKVGIFITEVEIDNDYGSDISIEETLDLVEKNCTNLEKIVLKHRIPSNSLILPSNIKSISIQFPENWIVSHQFLDELRKYKSLEFLSLKFYHSTQIESSFLIDLPPLKQLHLKNCSVEPMDLYKCLENSQFCLENLTLGNCFSELPSTLIDNIDRLSKLSQLGLRLSGTMNFGSPIIFRRLTSLKLSNDTANIDLDKLFNDLIEHNKIERLSLNLFENTKSLKPSTLQKLHHLTSLRRLFIYESDCVTDDFLKEISTSKNLTHFKYRQSYQPMLSLAAMIGLITVNGPKLQKCTYNIYHDISEMNPKSEEKRELMDVFRRTTSFRRILQCKEDISCKMTSVEFTFKNLQSIRC